MPKPPPPVKPDVNLDRFHELNPEAKPKRPAPPKPKR